MCNVIILVNPSLFWAWAFYIFFVFRTRVFSSPKCFASEKIQFQSFICYFWINTQFLSGQKCIQVVKLGVNFYRYLVFFIQFFGCDFSRAQSVQHWKKNQFFSFGCAFLNKNTVSFRCVFYNPKLGLFQMCILQPEVGSLLLVIEMNDFGRSKIL